MSTTPRFFGKYRGRVVGNVDPQGMGRILAVVPDVGGGQPTTWALPCLPMAGPQLGLYALPPIGASVWIEFERGDLDYPIWVGCFWADPTEVPAGLIGKPPAHTLAVALPDRSALRISDSPEGPGIHLETGAGARLSVTAAEITLETAGGAKLTVSDTALSLDNGKGAVVKLQARSIDFNMGALKID